MSAGHCAPRCAARGLLLLLLVIGSTGCSATRMGLAGDVPQGVARGQSETKRTSAVDMLMGPLGRRVRGAEWEQQKQDAAATGATQGIPGLSEYFAAEKLYESGNYAEAEKSFKALVRARKWEGRSWAERTVDQLKGQKKDAFDAYYSEYGDPVEEDALFMVAECRYHQKKYSWAQDSYGELIERYPATRHLDAVTRRLFEIAHMWMGFPEVTSDGQVNLASADAVANNPKQASKDFQKPSFFNFTSRSRPIFDTSGRALQALESIWLHDPNGPLADDALMLTANYHLRTNDYVEAARVYELLREQYPDSPHFKDAFLLDSFVRQASYDGPGYDTRPLEDARRLKQDARQMFPELTDEQRKRLETELVRISEAEVADLWHLVEFYQRKQNPSGIALHCNMILTRFPDSAYATRARQTLQALADEHRGESQWWLQNGLAAPGTASAQESVASDDDGAGSPKGTSGQAAVKSESKPPSRSKPSLLDSMLRRVEKDPELRPVER